MCVYMRVTYALTIVSTCIICIGEDPYELLWGEQRRIKPPAAPEEQSAPENRRDYGMDREGVGTKGHIHTYIHTYKIYI